MKFTTNELIYDLDTMVIDLNGTLTVGGVIDDKVKESLKELSWLGRRLILLTWNQRGNADQFAQYGMEIIKASNAHAKEGFIMSLDIDKCVAIGNARIDIWMFKHVAISIATLQAEGIHKDIIEFVDIIVPSMESALNLFIDPNRFAATMKI